MALDNIRVNEKISRKELYIGWRWRHFNDFIYVYRC